MQDANPQISGTTLVPLPSDMIETDPETAGDLQGERRNTIDSARLSIHSRQSARYRPGNTDLASAVDPAGPRQASQDIEMQMDEEDQAVIL